MALLHSTLLQVKKFSEGKQVHEGMEASKTNQTRWEKLSVDCHHKGRGT